MKLKNYSVGNYVTYEGDVFKITSIDKDGNIIGILNKALMPSEISTTIDRVSGIRITPEYLGEFGFCKNIDNAFVNSWSKVLVQDHLEISVFNPGSPNEMVFLKNPGDKDIDIVTVFNYDWSKEVYVHQIQNIIDQYEG